MASYFIGVDVGTGSARAGVFDPTAEWSAVPVGPSRFTVRRPILLSSLPITSGRRCVTRFAMRLTSRISTLSVKGLGFDATCSLVVLDKEGKPLTISPSGRSEQNIIVWMDHRAITQAERINALHHRVLDYVGGIISPEMQTPKLLWLKQHMPNTGQCGILL